jgi:protocatechuate 3,4-dioxygenase beta subunit
MNHAHALTRPRNSATLRALATASLLLCLSSQLAAQVPVSPPPPPPPAPAAAPPSDNEPENTSALTGPASWSITGTVVSATTGTPLDRADVTLSTPGPRGTQIAESVTAENGSFRFDHLQPGKYKLQASRRGYIAAGYQEHDGFFTGIVAGPDLDSEDLRLQLFSTAIIAGTITDESGEPIGGAQVHLYRLDQNTGEGKIIGAGSDTTDDNGTYEFARLKAGTYYVGVSATPWYAFHPPRKTAANGVPLPADQQPHSPLDVAYPMSFYANATDSGSATPIALNAGDRTEVNMSLHAVPAILIQVEFRVQDQGSGRGTVMPMLTQEVFGSDQMQPGSVTWMSSPNHGQPTGDFGGVAPGQYVLRQYPQQGEPGRTASVDLTTDQVVDFSSTSVSGVDVSGKLVMASRQPLPDRTSVLLAPANNGPSLPPARVDRDGAFDLQGVSPGNYEVRVLAPGSTLAVTQMAATGGDVQGTHIAVGTDPVLIAATLASGSTTITGYAKRDGKGIGGAMIVLVPQNPNASHELFRRDQSNSDGSFTLNRVIPGNYTVVAIEDGWTLDWARPEVIGLYLATGINVQITGKQKDLALPSSVEVQPR